MIAACGPGSARPTPGDGGLESDAGSTDTGSTFDGQQVTEGGQAADSATPTHATYDVVVVGAGTGGIAAAIQAARLKSKVALLEETENIGGQMTAAAVSNIDGAYDGGTGIYREFEDRVRAYYGDTARFPPHGKSIHTCYWNGTSTVCFEPVVGETILRKMLVEAGVDLLLTTTVVGALKSGGVVTGVKLQTGGQLHANVVIDATEYGDVIPLAGAAYRAGNSRSGALDLSACIQDLTYVASVKKYPNGLPAGFKISSPPPDYGSHKAKFAAYVTKNGMNSWDGWDKLAPPVTWRVHNAYRGLPDSDNPQSYTSLELDKITRTNVNWANDYPGSLPGALSVDYLEKPTIRKQTNCTAKLLTLNFIYYLQTELGETKWSVANDQGYDTNHHKANLCPNIPAALKPLEQHLPPMPYVRESRRIVAVKTLTAKEILRDKDAGWPPRPKVNFPTSVAVGDYGTDLHGCKDTPSLEADLGETSDDNHGGYGALFQIPFATLVPIAVDGLLAAEKNIGVSRLASGATRLQPVTMATGQAAGAIAALAVQGGVQPRQVRPIDVQGVLVNAGSDISVYSFSDVPRSSTLWPPVQLVSARKIMVGNGTQFDPNGTLDRSQAATVLANLLQLPTNSPPTSPTFNDVAPTHWAYARIEAVYKAGIASGCSAGPPKLFCPSDPTTRAMLATFMVRALGIDPNQAPMGQIFADVPPSHPLFEYVQLAADRGLFKGCSSSPKTFCPDAPTSRGDTARVVARVLPLMP